MKTWYNSLFRFEWLGKPSNWKYRLDIIPSDKDIDATTGMDKALSRPTNIVYMPNGALKKFKFSKKIDKGLLGLTTAPVMTFEFNINNFMPVGATSLLPAEDLSACILDDGYIDLYFGILPTLSTPDNFTLIYFDDFFHGTTVPNRSHFGNHFFSGNIYELYIDYTGVGNSYNLVYRGLQTLGQPLRPDKDWNLEVTTIDANSLILQFCNTLNLNEFWRLYTKPNNAVFVARQCYYELIVNQSGSIVPAVNLPSFDSARANNGYYWFFRVHDLSRYIDAIATEVGRLALRNTNYYFTSNLEYMISPVNYLKGGSNYSYYKQKPTVGDGTLGTGLELNDFTHYDVDSGTYNHDNTIFYNDLYYLGNVSNHDNDDRELSDTVIWQGGFHENCVQDFKNFWDLIYDIAQSSCVKCQMITGFDTNEIKVAGIFDRTDTITLTELDYWEVEPEFGSEIINKSAVSIGDTQGSDIGNINRVNVLSRNQKNFTLPVIFTNIPLADDYSKTASGISDYGTMKDMTDSMNSDNGGEGMQRGFTDAGKPEPTDAGHKRRMRQGGLADNEALEFYENPEDGSGVTQPGGFLKRNNYGDRF